MKTQNIGWGKVSDQEIQNLEARLTASLQVVNPRPEFVADLRKRLAARPGEVSIPVRPRKTPLLLTMFGVLSGSILLLFGVRVFIGYVESQGGVENFWQQLQNRRTARLPDAA